MKRRNKRMLGAAIAFGAATVAGAVTAYKIKRISEEDIVENFDDYYEDNCDCKEYEDQNKFSIKKVIKNIKNCCCEEGIEEQFEEETPFQTTMQFRRNRVYKKPLKGIKGQKSIY